MQTFDETTNAISDRIDITTNVHREQLMDDDPGNQTSDDHPVQDGEDSEEEWLPREAAAVSRSLATAAPMLHEEDTSQLEGSEEMEGMEAQEQ